MKACQLLTIALLFGTSAQANVYVPRAKLAGETVKVRLSGDSAIVTAVFEFEERITRDAKVVYFPIFATDTNDPLQVRARAKFEIEIGGRKTGIAMPCKSPREFGKPPSGVRACWFVANLDDLIDDSEKPSEGRIALKATYVQPLLRGTFYYLPVMSGHVVPGGEERSWQYQMHARSPSHLIRVQSKGIDSEEMDDGIVVYLKDGELVELQ
jgi:hypothetical protein